jgi:hypothetical protein
MVLDVETSHCGVSFVFLSLGRFVKVLLYSKEANLNKLRAVVCERLVFLSNS